MQIVGEVIEHLMGDMYVSQYLRKGHYFDNLTENNQRSLSLKRMLSKSSLPAVSGKLFLMMFSQKIFQMSRIERDLRR